MEMLIILAVLATLVAPIAVVVGLLVWYNRPNPNLVRCPDCGRRISRQAPACPGCGRPMPPG
jgi:hypothetical protein